MNATEAHEFTREQKLEAYVQECVAKAPPLTQDQLDRIAILLRVHEDEPRHVPPPSTGRERVEAALREVPSS